MFMKADKKEVKMTEKTGKKVGVGITAEKDELSEWFTQLLQKAELIEYTNVSGCYILRPRAYSIWEKVQKYFDDKIKKDGVKNAYFPLLIPKSNLVKEQKHVEGFTPEVAWVTRAGDTELAEPLAIRPTSETIMYPAYSKWIRSWRDLPLRINQWANMIRWEFKNPVPFIRSREFLWQEGHSAFATKEEADAEAKRIWGFYADVYREMYAIPVLKGKKTDKEKFAGADYTLTVEAYLPSGKSAQAATSHCLGQNFSKAFDIKFKDKDEKDKLVWQNSWGISTRSIGIAIMMHSDDKGLVLSPNVADVQVAIVPIFKDDKEKKVVMEAAEEVKSSIKNFRVELDGRDYSPGWKFNDHEMKGVPLRIEIGPRDVKEKQVVLVRRDNGKKENVKAKDIKEKVSAALEDIHNSLYNKADKLLKENLAKAERMADLLKLLEAKKLVLVPLCDNPACEDELKSQTGGAKTICIPEEQPSLGGKKCIICGRPAKYWVYVGKSY